MDQIPTLKLVVLTCICPPKTITTCAMAMGCGTHINAIRCDLFALEMGDLTARPVLYGDVRACWQVGIQGCGGCCHKEGDAANKTVHQHRPGCLLSHNWLHTPDCKVVTEMKNNTVHQHRPGYLLSHNWLHDPDGKVSNYMNNTVHQQRCNSCSCWKHDGMQLTMK